MKIALIGYGKMGIAIEDLSVQAGHTISYKVGKDNKEQIEQINAGNTDVVIEFSDPSIAVKNILYCLQNNIPVVCGTTGWLEEWDTVKDACKVYNGSFFYASNYSIGVNLFFKINEFAAKLMVKQSYTVEVEEIHHTEKKDSPSGTAISIVEPIIKEQQMNGWVNTESGSSEEIRIISKREPNVPGTHTVRYTSTVDEISMTHIAHTRKGFAKGALAVAEWIYNTDEKGMLTMNNFLTL